MGRIDGYIILILPLVSFSQIPNPLCLPFSTYVNSVAASCLVGNSDDSNNRNLSRARDILIRSNIYSSQDFSGVSIRWCNIPGTQGMVPRKRLILLSDDLRSRSAEDLVPLLAHEMYHITQYNDWGSNEFHCKYSREYLQHSTGRNNSVERPAYVRGDCVKDNLSHIISGNRQRLCGVPACRGINVPLDETGVGEINPHLWWRTHFSCRDGSIVSNTITYCGDRQMGRTCLCQSNGVMVCNRDPSCRGNCPDPLFLLPDSTSIPLKRPLRRWKKTILQ